MKCYIRGKIQDNQPYNESFTEREIKATIKQKNTAPGEDHTSSDNKNAATTNIKVSTKPV